MIIENVEALKTWLIASLKPICDADPASLAKYVVALVKKDKPEKDLRDVCTDQLDVFLQTKTKGFVDSLFEGLNNKSYLNASNETVKPVPAEPKTSEPETVKTEPVKKEEAIPDNKKPRGPVEKPKDVKRDERRRTSRSLSPRERRRDYDDRRKRFEDRRISDERRPYRRRSRSRSYSPRRSPRRLRRSRSPRGRSRSWSRSRSRSRPRSWSRSRSRSWTRSRSRSRDRKGKRPLPDSRGSTPTLDNGKYGISTIGHIPTVGAGVYTTAQGDGRFTIETQAQGKPQPSARQRCKDYDEKGFCLRGDLCQFDHGLDPVVVEDVSIPPPYIPGGPPPPNGGPRMPGPGPGPRGPGPGPGFMPHRGPPPPHQMIPRHPPPRNDHFEAYNPEAPAMTHPPPPSFWHGPPPPNGPPPPPHGGPPNQPPFLPQQQQQLPMQMRQRDHLVTIPVKQEDPPIVPPGTEASVSPDNEVQAKKPESRAPEGKSERTVIAPKRPYDNVPYHRNDNNVGPPPAKKPFDYNRIGGKSFNGYRKPNFDNTITQLEVRKIPKQFNNITSINEHFSKFGTLTNIQVNFEGDAEAALVSFATNDQALACYRSSEPLFNNRFVKVFWHKDKENDQSNPEKPAEDHRSVKARLGPPVIPHPSKMTYNNVEKKPAENPSQENKEKTILYTSSVGSITKTVYNPEAIKARKTLTSPTAVSSAGFVSKIEAIKRREEQKKDALKKKQEIENKKHELRQKQLNQQKMLIEKLEKNKNMSTEEKNKIKETLKILTSSIEKINTGMAPKKAVASKIANPEQARKEILDTELELFNKQHTGEDTSDLKKKLSELTKQATAMGLLGRGRGRGKVVKGAATKWVAEGLAGRGRGSTASYHQPGGSRVLDNRPKQLEVSGYSEEEKDQLLPHFSSFGQVEKVDQSEDENSAIVTFKTRRDAEKAMFRAAKFHGKTLSLKWHMEVKVKINLNISSDDSFTADAEEVEDSEVGGGEDELDEEALLAGDDEEEEDEESRSWRR